MDDCWRVMHALPRRRPEPAFGGRFAGADPGALQTRSPIFKPRRMSTASRRFMRTRKCSISTRYRIKLPRPAAHYPARARPGQPLCGWIFSNPPAAQVPPDLVRHQQELMGPVAQFLTGLFPAVFGGENGFAEDGERLRDGARSGAWPVRTRVAATEAVFISDVMLLSVDCFRKNRPEDAEIPILGPGGEFESHWIRLADLKGNIQAYPESDENFSKIEIPAAQRSSAIDGVVRSAHSASARRSREHRVREECSGIVRPGSAGRGFAKQTAFARLRR